MLLRLSVIVRSQVRVFVLSSRGRVTWIQKAHPAEVVFAVNSGHWTLAGRWLIIPRIVFRHMSCKGRYSAWMAWGTCSTLRVYRNDLEIVTFGKVRNCRAACTGE